MTRATSAIMSEVFVTSHGSAYHTHRRHIMTGSGKKTITRRQAIQAGYVPCQHCFPGSKPRIVRARRDGSPQYKELP